MLTVPASKVLVEATTDKRSSVPPNVIDPIPKITLVSPTRVAWPIHTHVLEPIKVMTYVPIILDAAVLVVNEPKPVVAALTLVAALVKPAVDPAYPLVDKDPDPIRILPAPAAAYDSPSN